VVEIPFLEHTATQETNAAFPKQHYRNCHEQLPTVGKVSIQVRLSRRSFLTQLVTDA
jgi:hypothetical protein